jgi:hypothetical protein
LSSGQRVYVASGGYYFVASGAVPTFTLQNLGISGINIPVGSPVAAANVSPGGYGGATGVTGATGPTGPQGSPGVTGATGPTGAQGIQGSPGVTGTTGPIVSIVETIPMIFTNNLVTGSTGCYLSGFFSQASQTINAATISVCTGAASAFFSVAIYTATGTLVGSVATGPATAFGFQITSNAMAANLAKAANYYAALSVNNQTVIFAGATGATGPSHCFPGFNFGLAATGTAYLFNNTSAAGSALVASGCTGTLIVPWIALTS